MPQPVYTAYCGPSMNPTLVEPALMEIIPYLKDSAVRPGDVILYKPSNHDASVVHRVMRITSQGIVTRGDHNSLEDPAPVQFDEITGRVVATMSGKHRRSIRGGWIGLGWHYFLRSWFGVHRLISRLLHAPYHALAEAGFARALLPSRMRPRVVVFKGTRLLMMGPRLIGQYDPRRGTWQIKRPFRLFCDPETLK